ncbi:MAG: hypothetical protein FVQ83_14595 [Chloroflexi bacterium]|nr:hypothetical protein [Chloroflexota bacterium]
MKGTDKFLIAIVVGVIILAAAAIGVALMQSEAAYLSDDTPEGVTHNYLLAIQNEDYERAYSYLSPDLIEYPEDVIEFKRDINLNLFIFRQNTSNTIEILSSSIYGENADVEVRETSFHQGDFFDSYRSTNNFVITLTIIDGEWKIVNGDYYFAPCWRDYGCKN